MDIHHDTSFKFILKDDSISSTFRTYICFCSGKRVGLYLIVRPSIHLFCIAHFTFTSMMHFCLGLIQPLTFNLFMCECGQRLNTSRMHLAHCLFGGQRITTHDTIRSVMYAFTWKSGHIVWRKQWYALTSKVSLWIHLYMTCEDQVFVANVMVIDST
jgi:hypothetical protein